MHDVDARLLMMDIPSLDEIVTEATAQGGDRLLLRSELGLEMGRIGEARRDAERALKLSKDIARAGTPSADLGAAYLALGRALRADGEPEAARAAFGAAHEQLGPTLGPDHPDTRTAERLAGEASGRIQ